MATSTVPSIRVTKQMPWRGGTRLYSNRYHFNGGVPADQTKWTTFSDAVVTAEKAALSNQCTIVETQGFDAGSDVAVFQKTYSTAGTFATAGTQVAPGEVAALVRYATATRTSKNHPLYLFNYYHNVVVTSAVDADTLVSGMVGVLGTYAALWVAGISDGTATHHRAGPQGDVATGYLVETKVTHRDFPRA